MHTSKRPRQLGRLSINILFLFVAGLTLGAGDTPPGGSSSSSSKHPDHHGGPMKEPRSVHLRTRVVKGILLGPGVVVPPGTDFAGQDLSDLNLQRAVLDGVDLRGANLGGSDLTGATLGSAVLGGAKFRDTCLFNTTTKDFYHLGLGGEARMLPFHTPEGKWARPRNWWSGRKGRPAP